MKPGEPLSASQTRAVSAWMTSAAAVRWVVVPGYGGTGGGSTSGGHPWYGSGSFSHSGISLKQWENTENTTFS